MNYSPDENVFAFFCYFRIQIQCEILPKYEIELTAFCMQFFHDGKSLVDVLPRSRAPSRNVASSENFVDEVNV